MTINLDLAAYLGLAVDDPQDLLGRRCELSTGTPIGRRTAERLLCEADITALLTRTGLDGIIEPLGVAHSKRYPIPSERRALALRDKGCVFPGGDTRVEWTNAHHLDHWHLYETTQLSRLVLLCRYHHHQVHEGGFRLERHPDGTITVIRPTGTLLPRAAPGRLLREPTEHPDNPAVTPTGRPGQPAAVPLRPRTRFRTPTQQRQAAQHRADLVYLDAHRRGIQLVIGDLECLSQRAS